MKRSRTQENGQPSGDVTERRTPVQWLMAVCIVFKGCGKRISGPDVFEEYFKYKRRVNIMLKKYYAQSRNRTWLRVMEFPNVGISKKPGLVAHT